jgi:hypothetical protein
MSPREDEQVLGITAELRRVHAKLLWQERIQEIDPLFAQVVYLARLRGPSGRYRDPVLSRVMSSTMCHRLIGDAHRHAFREWLALSLRAKCRDLRAYRASICLQPGERAIGAWSRLCRELVPSGVSITELTLFLNTAGKIAHIMTTREDA